MRRPLTVAVVLLAVVGLVASPVAGVTAPGETTASERAGTSDDDVPAPPSSLRTLPSLLASDLPSLDASRLQAEKRELTRQERQAAEEGAREGVRLAQEQGVEVSQEQRQAAIDGAVDAAAQSQQVSAEQIQSATQGAAHGALVQGQSVEAEQVQATVEGGAAGALLQGQEATVVQLQGAAYGATHGTLSQVQVASVEQLQSAARGGAGGSVAGAVQEQVTHVGQLQEAAQGAAYGSLVQAQRVTAEQIQYAALGASHGALVQSQEANIKQVQVASLGAAQGALTQVQRVTVEQIQYTAQGASAGALSQVQQATIEQIQYAAEGAASGTIVQAQRASVEQVQAASLGGAQGALTQAQRVTVEQVQVAARGACRGVLSQSQRVTVEQIQVATRGAAGGALTQVQKVTVEQVQRAAQGAGAGAVQGAIQHQVVEIEQVQAAASGAASGAIAQIQRVSIEQVQYAAQGAARGALVQRTEVTVEQIQYAAQGAAHGSLVQRTEITVRQVMAAAEGAASGGVTMVQTTKITLVQAVTRGAAAGVLRQYTEVTVEQIQYVARGTCQGVLVRIEETASPLRAQYAAQNGASQAAQSAAQQGVDDPAQLEEIGEDSGGEEVENPSADLDSSIAFENQSGDGATVTIGSVSLEEGGFVAVHDAEAADGGLGPDTVRGVSGYLEAGDHEGVAVELDEPINGSASLAAVAHKDTDDDREFDFGDADGVDDPYLSEGEPNAAVATVTVDEDAAEASVAFEDQTSEGDAVTVASVNLSAGGFVSIRNATDGDSNESVVGSSVYLEPGAHEDVTVELDESIEGNWTATATVHRDTNDDQSFDFSATGGEEDEPYRDAGDPVTDDAEIAVEGAANATLSVADQTGSGDNLAVENASAPEEFYLEARADDETRNRTEAFDADEGFAGNLTLEPALAENATVEVAVHDAESDELLVAESIEYTVEEAPNETGPNASIVFEEQTTNGTNVTVASVNLTDGGFVAIYEEPPGDAATGTVLGTSAYLEAGDHEGIDVELDEPLEESTNLTAVAHEDTNDDRTFDYGDTGGEEDAPYLDDEGEPVAASALVEVEAEATTTVIFEDQTTNGSSVTVQSVNSSDGGFVAIHDESVLEGDVTGSVLGVSGYLEPGDQEDVTVALDEPLEESGTLVATVYRDTNDDEAFDFVTTDGEEDEPYLDDADEPVSDDAEITIEVPAANFTVAIDGTNSPIRAGETLEVNATVENVGNESGTQEIGLDVGTETNVTTETLALDAGESRQVGLTYETVETDVGEQEVVVHSENDSDATTITVEEAAEPAFFAVEILEATDPVTVGETLSVTVAIENTGEQAGTQSVALAVDGTPVDEREVALEPAEAEQVILEFDPRETDVGERELNVSSANDSDVRVVQVEPATPTPTETPTATVTATRTPLPTTTALPTQPPTTQPPVTQPPATQPPATNPPATQPPATQPPATQPPATQPPATQPPAGTAAGDLGGAMERTDPAGAVLWRRLAGLSPAGALVLTAVLVVRRRD